MKLPAGAFWLRLGVVAALAGILVYTYRSRRYEQPRPLPTGSAAQPTLETRNVTLHELHKGKQIWTMRARSGSYDEDHRRVRLKDVTLDFYEASRRVATITAPSGELNTGTRDIVLPGGAEGQAPARAIRFSARRVAWSAGTQTLTGSGGVRFRQAVHEIDGEGFRADVAWQRVRMTGGVRARLFPYLVNPGVIQGR